MDRVRSGFAKRSTRFDQVISRELSTALPELHDGVQMRAQYKVAIREDEAWNFQRVLEYAKSVLLPETKRIIALDVLPDLASLDNLP